jgi:hypothetical protein
MHRKIKSWRKIPSYTEDGSHSSQREIVEINSDLSGERPSLSSIGEPLPLHGPLSMYIDEAADQNSDLK